VIEFHLDGKSGVPAYLQLVQQVRQAIRLGILRPDDQLPDMAGDRVAAGTIPLPAASITFLAIPDAANPSCR